VRVRPVTWESLVGEVTGDLLKRDGRVRVAVDAAAALGPGRFAFSVVATLRAAGRFALHVDGGDFLLPASQRFEFGRSSADWFYEGWRDERGLRREVLDPAATGGSGRVLPALWRTDIDRSARADYVAVPADGITVVSGQFLLGSGLAFEVAVHLSCSAAALARRTPAEQQWTLPAYLRYDDEVGPAAIADLVVRVEDPRRPAVVERD
jgi:hypothetical protein